VTEADHVRIRDNLEYCPTPAGDYSAPANFLVQIESFLKSDFKQHHTRPSRWRREAILDAIQTVFPNAAIASSSSNAQEPPKITGLAMKARVISEDGENDDDHSTLIDGSLVNRPSMDTRSCISDQDDDYGKPNYQKGYEVLYRDRMLNSNILNATTGDALTAFACLAAVQERSPVPSIIDLPEVEDNDMTGQPDSPVNKNTAVGVGNKRKRATSDDAGTTPKRAGGQLPAIPALDESNIDPALAEAEPATTASGAKGKGKAKAPPRKRAPPKPKPAPKGKGKAPARGPNAAKGSQEPGPSTQDGDGLPKVPAPPKKHVKLKTSGLYPGVDHCPHETYSVSCYKVIRASPYGRLRLRSIYAALKAMYPYYASLSNIAPDENHCSEMESFRNSMRHNLSLHK
jgi:hypothetical protein